MDTQSCQSETLPHVVSKHWPLVPLGDVLTPSEEWINLQPDAGYQEVTVKLWGKGVTLRRQVKGAEVAAKRRLIVHENQFILSRIDARNGAFGLIPEDLDGAIVSNDFPVFNPVPSRILPAFLAWMSKTHEFVEICKAASEGTTNRVRLKGDRFLKTKIPLPPLDEQRRIVARIEALTAKIEEARGFRSDVLLETKAMLEAGKRRLLGDSKTNTLNWPTKKLRDIADLRYGISAAISGSADPVLGTPIIRMANMTLDGTLDLRDLRYYPLNSQERGEFLLRQGDLLLNWRSGSAAHVGKTALFEQSGDFTFASFLLRVRVDAEQASPEYMRLILNFMRSEGVFLDAQRFQVNTKLNADEFGNFQIMLPTLLQQRRIVAYLDDLQAKVDTLKRLQAETAAELDALLPSILDKAFKGEL